MMSYYLMSMGLSIFITECPCGDFDGAAMPKRNLLP